MKREISRRRSIAVALLAASTGATALGLSALGTFAHRASAEPSGPSSWNPYVHRTPVRTTIEQIIGNRVGSCGGATEAGGGFPNHLKGTEGATEGQPTPDEIPPSIAFVEIDGVRLERTNRKRWGVGDGDATTNATDPSRTEIRSTYMKGIHLEVSGHWGTTRMPDGSTRGPFLYPYPQQTVWPAAGTLVDVQGFVRWDSGHVSEPGHYCSGWELHPVSAWRLHQASDGGGGGSGPAGTPSTPVDVTNDVYANNEESLGMSPDGKWLAGAWNDWEYNDGCGFSYSTDGGDTWAPESFAPFTAFSNTPGVDPIFPTQFAVAGDPSVAFNPKSQKFDVICQAFGTPTGNQIQLLSTTFDPTKANRNADVDLSYGRAAWTPPVAITTGTSNGSQKGSNGKFPDHEAVTVDTGTGPGHHFGRLYVAWAEFNGSGRSPIDVAYSDDDGAHWTGPIRVSDNGNQFDQDAIPRVGPDGSVYVSWINGPNEKSLKDNAAMIDKSSDGGATWGTDQVAAHVASPIGGLLPNSNYRVFEDVNSVVDQQSGRVVLAYTDQKSGASNIYVTHTLGAGDITRWSAPVAVKPSGQEQFFPWLSAAPNGRVDLVFYDRSCDPVGDKRNCVTLASTTDDGVTWGYTPLLSTPFDGDLHHACTAPDDPEACGRNFLGDYIAVASTDAKAQALWTGNGAHGMDVYSGRATFSP